MEYTSVRLIKLNWDEECELDFLAGRGFEIKEKITSKKDRKGKKLPGAKSDGKKKKSKYGIQSPLFMTDWDDDNAFEERYSCKCKELKGRVFEGEKCPICLTEVKFRDVDLKIFGWIKIYNYKIIQPLYYKMLSSALGKKVFNEIVEYDKELTKDGMIVDKSTKNRPFKGIGIIEFYDRFEEIMNYYYNKKKNKREIIKELIEEKDNIFVSSIPVYSSAMRPISFKNESFFFTGIDKKLNTIVSDSLILNRSEYRLKSRSKKARMDDPIILNSIQRNLNLLWDEIFKEINQKHGHIRNNILGGRLNFAARNVIRPDPTLRADEVRICYMTFLELYKYEIISHVVKINDCSYNEAYDIWYRATIFYDEKIYKIMNYILKKYKSKVKIIRNPTINYGSLLCMKIKSIIPVMDDFTMALPIQILTCLNADFDGDIMNIVSFKTKKMANEFDKTFNPRKNMYISRINGLFNNDFNLLKDQIIGLYEFNNC